MSVPTRYCPVPTRFCPATRRNRFDKFSWVWYDGSWFTEDAPDNLPKALFDRLTGYAPCYFAYCRYYDSPVAATAALRAAWAALPEGDRVAVRLIAGGRALAAAL